MMTTRSRRNGIDSMMRKLSLAFALIFSIILFLSPCNAKISDKRLCYDKDCSVVVSIGRTMVPYHSKDYDVLSFPPNTEVKIFSKQAGNRPDLWGVEIKGKRGYAPSRFIRESKVFYSELEHLVPTGKLNNKQIEDANQEADESVKPSTDTTSNNAQKENIQKDVPLSESATDNFKETIKPDEVTRPYDSVYDGTLIPEDFADIQAPELNYSTRTLLNTVEKGEEEKEEEEEVKLDLYPKFIKSTLSALSGILGSGDESTEEGSVEVLSSKSIINEGTTEKTPEIEKINESSQHTKEKHTTISEETVVQEIVPQVAESVKILPQEIVFEEIMSHKAVSEKLVSSQELPKQVLQDTKTPEIAPQESLPQEPVAPEPIRQEIASQEVLPQESAVPETVSQKTSDEELPQETTIPKTVPERVDLGKILPTETVVQEKELEDKQPEIVADQSSKEKSIFEESSKQGIQQSVTDATVEILQKGEDDLNKVKTNETDSSVNNQLNESVNQSGSLEEGIKSENITTDSTSSENTSFDKDFFIHVQKEVKIISDDLVPKQKEGVAVTDNLVNTQNETDSEASVQQSVLAKQTVDEQKTTANSANIEESIISKVPLNEEIIPASSKSFIPHEEPSQQNLSNVPFENKIEMSVNLTAPDVFTEENPNLTDDALSLEKIPQISDNTADRESNTTDNALSLEKEPQISDNTADRELNTMDNALSLEKEPQMSDNTADSNTNNVVDTYTTGVPTYPHNDSTTESSDFQTADSSHESIADVPSTPSFGEFLGNRNLLNAGKSFQHEDYSEEIVVDQVVTEEKIHTTTSSGLNDNLSNVIESKEEQEALKEISSDSNVEKIVIPPETCDTNFECSIDHEKVKYTSEENAVTGARKMVDNSETLLYVCITAVTTLLFSLGYYFIENKRRDAYLIAKINNLEKDLMITRKECIMLDENFKSTKTKLDSIEDESFGSNEMVLSLKAELTASESARAEQEDQIASLEKELESTSEAGLELERMLREILSTQSEENNPLARSIEDLQERLNNQQVANESLQNALAIKTQENETLTTDLAVSLKKAEQLQGEVKKLGTELRTVTSAKINLEQTLQDQVQTLEIQIKSMTEDNTHLRKQLRMKELEVKDLLGIIEQVNANSIDYEKIYEVSQIKAEAKHLLEERDELKIKLSEEEGAHQLLEEHVKLVKEEVAFLSEQCKVAEKEKKDAETRLEVLTKFFEEKEAQRQKEEAIWLEKQGEVSSTVERLQTMQNEILHYKQQIEMLRREIVDQEREYKSQISVLETKAHEHWVAARQNERRLEEVKAESSQLRNRLTLVEKNISEVDPEAKLHRLREIGQNGETGGGALNHQLFPGGETSSSPLMFGGGVTGPVPPLPPPPLGSYHHHHHMFPPLPLPGFMPPPPPPGSGNVNASSELVGSRPPPLGGGRLSSPPPHMPPSSNPAASPPPLSPPPALMPFPPHLHHPTHHPHPLHPPLPPYASDVPPSMMHPRHHPHLPPPPPPPSSQQQQQERGGHTHNSNWGDDNAVRNTSGGYNTQQRDQRSKNHKGSLHSSGESLDKSYHGGKV